MLKNVRANNVSFPRVSRIRPMLEMAMSPKLSLSLHSCSMSSQHSSNICPLKKLKKGNSSNHSREDGGKEGEKLTVSSSSYINKLPFIIRS